LRKTVWWVAAYWVGGGSGSGGCGTSSGKMAATQAVNRRSSISMRDTDGCGG